MINDKIYADSISEQEKELNKESFKKLTRRLALKNFIDGLDALMKKHVF